MPARAIALATILLATIAPGLTRAEPPARAPKLDPAPVAPPAADEAARPLPETVAICQDRTAGRCWLAPRARDCHGQPFRVVIAGEGREDAAAGLADCRAALEDDRGR